MQNFHISHLTDFQGLAVFFLTHAPVTLPDPGPHKHSMDGPCHREVDDFQHDILPDASKYIRLVEVLEGNNNAAYQAHFRMSTWPIDDLPSYHAISYTWGHPESNTVILINDRTFRVRTNCESALKQAWEYKRKRFYWIDAICIDQGNGKEKGKQVAMMGNIYKTAYSVLACVGEHADDSLFLYRKLASTKKSSETLLRSPRARGLLRQAHRLLTVRRYLRAAVHFAKRSYFSRLWIVQELKTARQAEVLCGADALPKERIWRLFKDLDESSILREPGWTGNQRTRTERLAQWTIQTVFYRRSSHDDQLSTEIANAVFVTADYPNSGRPFFRSGFLQCTQRRDRIYGILSIIDWGEIIPPSPDYTKSDFDVALDCIKPIFEVTRGERYYELGDICSDIKRALELSVWSDSVSGALAARRGVRESDFAGSSMRIKMRINPPPTQFQSEAKGWCLSGEHFISRRQSTHSEWKVPHSTGTTAVLPHWLREGDWILEPNKFYDGRGNFLVIREVAGVFYSPILGQGRQVSSLLDAEAPADAIFQIFWNTEDLLVHCIMCQPIVPFGIKLVEFGVCKRENPGSSYAVRQK